MMQQKSEARGILKDPNFRIILGIVVVAVIGGSLVAGILTLLPIGITLTLRFVYQKI